MEGDNLVTVSVGPDNNKVVRKYEITKDGVVLVRSICMSVHIYTSFYRSYNSIQNFNLNIYLSVFILYILQEI